MSREYCCSPGLLRPQLRSTPSMGTCFSFFVHVSSLYMHPHFTFQHCSFFFLEARGGGGGGEGGCCFVLLCEGRVTHFFLFQSIACGPHDSWF